MTSRGGGRRRAGVAVGACLAIAAAVYLLLRGSLSVEGPKSAPAALPELSRTNLELRDGRLVALGQTNPFTGIVLEHYPDGVLLSRTEVSNGVLNGLSEGWHTNGVLQIEEHFEQGISHGIRKKFSPDGKLLSEASIENGEIVGVFRRWYENGQLSEEITMSNGVPHGESRSWYEDGRQKAWARLEQGTVVEQKAW